MDPGFGITGYGLIQLNSGGEGEPRLLEAGCIRTEKKKTLSQRLLEIHQQLTEILAEFAPIAVAIEDTYSLSAFPKSGIYIGHAQGIILLAAAQRKVPVFHYYPLQVKKSISGNGNATKNQIQKMVQALLKLKETPRPDDVADALAVALCHARRMRR